MKRNRTLRIWGGFWLLLLLLFTFLIWNIFAGSVSLSASEIWRILLGGDVGFTQSQIIVKIRLPRLLSALILGGALSLSGYLLQTFFHNPIAGPFVLGISSGAKMTVCVAMLALLSRGKTTSSAILIAAAFVGAMVSMGFVLLISQRVKRMSLLVVCGVMIGYICSALTDFLVTFADDSSIVNLHNWSLGSFSGMSWDNVKTMAVVCGITLLLTFLLSKPIRAYHGRGLCPEYGRPPAGLPDGADPVVQCAVRLRHGLCRPHLLCWHRSAAPDEVPVQIGGAAVYDPGLLFRRRRVLPVLRPRRPHRLCPHRGEHQLRHGGIRRTHRHLHDDPQKGGVSMAAYLETKALAVGYHGKPLIEDVALHVQRGKIVTLIGPNGSGKSTILKTIIGQLSKVSGTVFLDGKAMEERSRNEIARRMAILMTARMEPELMTCRDVVSSGRYPYTGRLGILRPEDQAIVERSLDQVGGMEFADRPFSAISDGQRQRILLARALCQEPEIIVLDEPTSFLDIRYKLELLTVLKRMVRENDLAVLLSLHELELAERISDTVVCVAGDRIDRIGTPEEIFTREYIAKLYRMEHGKYDPCFDSLEFVP